MSSEHLVLPNGAGHEPVAISDIQYIQSNRKLCTVVTVKGVYTLFASLRYFEEHLPEAMFQRIHKRYIVSLRYIRLIRKDGLFVADLQLPVSRMRKPALKGKFLNYSNKKNNERNDKKNK